MCVQSHCGRDSITTLTGERRESPRVGVMQRGGGDGVRGERGVEETGENKISGEDGGVGVDLSEGRAGGRPASSGLGSLSL